MSRERNLRLIQTWYQRMWNQWDKSAFEWILAPDILFRGSFGQVKRGYAGISEYMDFIRAAFPDFTNRIEDVVSEDDKAFARLQYTGTHEGESSASRLRIGASPMPGPRCSLSPRRESSRSGFWGTSTGCCASLRSRNRLPSSFSPYTLAE